MTDAADEIGSLWIRFWRVVPPTCRQFESLNMSYGWTVAVLLIKSQDAYFGAGGTGGVPFQVMQRKIPDTRLALSRF